MSPQPPQPDVATRLQQLAGQVALQLVGAALEQLLPGPRASDLVVTVTAPAPKLLVGRVKRKYTRRKKTAVKAKAQTSAPPRSGWSPARRRKFLATIAAKGLRVKKAAAKPKADLSIPAGGCKRCAHSAASHPDFGACLVHGCVCRAFFE